MRLFLKMTTLSLENKAVFYLIIGIKRKNTDKPYKFADKPPKTADKNPIFADTSLKIADKQYHPSIFPIGMVKITTLIRRNAVF